MTALDSKVDRQVSPGRAVQKLYINEKIHKGRILYVFDYFNQPTGKLTVNPSS